MAPRTVRSHDSRLARHSQHRSTGCTHVTRAGVGRRPQLAACPAQRVQRAERLGGPGTRLVPQSFHYCRECRIRQAEEGEQRPLARAAGRAARKEAPRKGRDASERSADLLPHGVQLRQVWAKLFNRSATGRARSSQVTRVPDQRRAVRLVTSQIQATLVVQMRVTSAWQAFARVRTFRAGVQCRRCAATGGCAWPRPKQTERHVLRTATHGARDAYQYKSPYQLSPGTMASPQPLQHAKAHEHVAGLDSAERWHPTAATWYWSQCWLTAQQPQSMSQTGGDAAGLPALCCWRPQTFESPPPSRLLATSGWLRPRPSFCAARWQHELICYGHVVCLSWGARVLGSQLATHGAAHARAH